MIRLKCCSRKLDGPGFEPQDKMMQRTEGWEGIYSQMKLAAELVRAFLPVQFA